MDLAPGRTVHVASAYFTTGQGWTEEDAELMAWASAAAARSSMPFVCGADFNANIEDVAATLLDRAQLRCHAHLL